MVPRAPWCVVSAGGCTSPPPSSLPPHRPRGNAVGCVFRLALSGAAGLMVPVAARRIGCRTPEGPAPPLRLPLAGAHCFKSSVEGRQGVLLLAQSRSHPLRRDAGVLPTGWAPFSQWPAIPSVALCLPSWRRPGAALGWPTPLHYCARRAITRTLLAQARGRLRLRRGVSPLVHLFRHPQRGKPTGVHSTGCCELLSVKHGPGPKPRGIHTHPLALGVCPSIK